MAILLTAGLALLGIGVVWWMLGRALNGDRQIEPGGSYGRNREPKKPDDDGQT
jgi:hypothetical protein